MLYRWLKRPTRTALLPLSLALLLSIACGSAAQPEAEQQFPTPAEVQARQPVAPVDAPAQPLDAPTAVPQPVQAPGDRTSGAEFAPVFAEYWHPPVDFYGQPVKGGTLRQIYEDALEHANTWGASTGAADRMRRFTNSFIVSLDPYDDTKIIPDLAMGWTEKDDATGITFFFHDNITWSNGEPFVCEDARFWIETMLTGEGVTAPNLKGNLSFINLDATKCVDDLTLEVGFNGPSAIGLQAFTKSDAVVFNKAWFEAGGEEAMFQDLSVGTGPFLWEPGQKVGVDTQRFARNPNYFKGDGTIPYLDGVVLVGIVDESAQQAAMLAHQGDWHWVRNWGQYGAYVDHDQIMTVIRPTRGHHTLWMNRRNPPFDNVRVRQAIVMGIDRNAAIQILQEGHASPGFIMPPGSQWELEESVGCAVPGWCQPEDMAAQRAEARRILEEEGFDFNKSYLFTVESDNQVVTRATFVQEQLRLIGVQTEFDLVETVAYRHQTTSGTWGDILSRNDTMVADDPFIGMAHYMQSGSVSNNHWVPATEIDAIQQQADDLLAQVAATVDPVQRKAISDKLQLLAMEQYWRFPIYWEQEAAAFWPEVRGYFHFPEPGGAHVRWEHMWIDPAHQDDAGFKGQTTGVPGGI
jgi:ABC-type transport system substrate-binding protein